MPRRALKIALIDADMRQKELARLTGIDGSAISRIISGEIIGTARQQKAIAQVLRRSIYDLFPESTGAIAS